MNTIISKQEWSINGDAPRYYYTGGWLFKWSRKRAKAKPFTCGIEAVEFSHTLPYFRKWYDFISI